MTPELLERLPTALFEIGKLVGQELDSGQLMSRIAKHVSALLDADACTVLLFDARRQQLSATAAWGLATERVHALTFERGEGVAGWVADSGEAALIDDVSDDPRFLRRESTAPRIVSMACVPLTARGERIGVLCVTSGQRAAFGHHHLGMLHFLASTIALDIENVRLHRVAVTDLLTGAFNREFLQQRLPVEIQTAADRGAPLSLAMVDVDHFKSVNDRYGHAVGDIVLTEVAQRLRAAIRGADLLVRYGGEEFLVVLPNADTTRAWEVGERMRQRVMSSPIEVGDTLLAVQVSIGVAEYATAASEAPLAVIRRADHALYAAKNKGRNRVEIAPAPLRAVATT